MTTSLKQFGLRMMSGDDKSLQAVLARATTWVIEPVYAGAMLLRNACYDRGIFKVRDLGRPTISVGNITTGGTGKTPVVHWLCEQLKNQGRHPAVLLRGYGDGAFSDEAELLKQALIDVPVMANPSRVAGAARVLKDHPQVDVFVLDDALQHRKARRDFNLVLISATQPFGFGHVLPRGLLREPLRGLKRADAFLITRCSLGAVEPIERYLMEHYPSIPIFQSDHRISISEEFQRAFLVAGIGDPAAFEKQISALGCQIVGTRWFSDHHLYTPQEMMAIDQAASAAHANIVLTTEKDWVKMKSVASQASEVSIGVVKLEVEFRGNEGVRLLHQIIAKTGVPASAGTGIG